LIKECHREHYDSFLAAFLAYISLVRQLDGRGAEEEEGREGKKRGQRESTPREVAGR
jgi:hypothetical protein